MHAQKAKLKLQRTHDNWPKWSLTSFKACTIVERNKSVRECFEKLSTQDIDFLPKRKRVTESNEHSHLCSKTVQLIEDLNDKSALISSCGNVHWAHWKRTTLVFSMPVLDLSHDAGIRKCPLMKRAKHHKRGEGGKGLLAPFTLFRKGARGKSALSNSLSAKHQ